MLFPTHPSQGCQSKPSPTRLGLTAGMSKFAQLSANYAQDTACFSSTTEESATFDWCNESDQTIEHILYECPALNANRLINFAIHPTMADLINMPD